MFGLFYSIVLAFFNGTWTNYTTTQALNNAKGGFAHIFELLGSLFSCFSAEIHTEGLTNPDDIQMILSYGTGMYSSNVYTDANGLVSYVPQLVAFIIALIVTIGVIMVTVRAIRSIFRVFLAGRLK